MEEVPPELGLHAQALPDPRRGRAGEGDAGGGGRDDGARLRGPPVPGPRLRTAKSFQNAFKYTI